MSSSVCANHGRSICSDVTDLSETWTNQPAANKEQDDLIAAEKSLLKEEEVWVFDMPDEDEMDRKDANDLLEDFPDSKDKDGCGESELYEDFPNRYECDDDDGKSVFSVANSVSSVLSAFSNLSFGSKRSTRSTRSLPSNNRRKEMKQLKQGWFGNSSKSMIENVSAKQSEKTLELTDDSTFNQQDGESENKVALAMLEDQTEFFENDAVDKLVNKMTYSSNRRLPPVNSSSVKQKASQLPSDNYEIKSPDDNPLENLMKKLKSNGDVKGENKLEDSFSLLPPELLYETDQNDYIEYDQRDNEKTNVSSNDDDNDKLGELPNDASFQSRNINYSSVPEDISNISLMQIYGQGCMPSIAERSERSLHTDRSGRSGRSGRSLLTDRSEPL